jgi:cell division protein FtsB
VTGRQIAGLVAALALTGVAVFAGEYSTVDWLKLHRQLAAEEDSVRALRGYLDSLARETRAMETDPAVQRRAAREKYGMIRDGEIIYQIIGEDKNREP